MNLARTFFFYLALCLTQLNAQTWQWANCEVGSNGEGWAICTDISNNAILVGSSTGPSVFGTNTYTSAFLKGCILKYDPSGNLLWDQVFRINGGGLFGVSTDNVGNVYATGTFAGSMVISTTTLVSQGGSDVFVLKLSSSGNLIWIKNFGTTNSDYSFALAGDANGNTVITGYFISPSITIGTVTVNNSSTQALYVAKFDSNGNVLWANSCPGSGYPRPNAIALDNLGNVYSTGQYSLQLSAANTTINGVGLTDIYVLKYSAAGVFQNLFSYGGAGSESGYGIELISSGDIYLSGAFNGSLTSIGSNTISTLGNYDAFIAKLNPSGAVTWLRQIGSSGVDIGYSMATYANGVYLASSVLSNSIGIGNNTYTFSTQNDGMALVQYDSSGNLLFSQAINGGGDDVMDICIDNSCALFLGGDLQAPSTTFGTSVLTHTAPESLFIAKMQIATSSTSLSITGSSSICAGTSTTLQANGSSTYTWSTGATSSSIVVNPTTNTTYVVYSSSPQAQCPISALHTLSVNSPPNITVSASPSVVCAGQPVTLTANGATSYTWSNGATGNTVTITTASTTNYSLVGSNATCTSSASVPLTVQALPQVSISVTPTFICRGQRVSLIATGAQTYTWNTASNSASINIQLNSSTSFSVIGQNTLSACTNTSSITLNANICENIEDQHSSGSINVYPNPSSGQLFVTSASSTELSILNAMGQTCFTFFIQAGEPIKLDISDLKPGIYHIKLNTAEKVLTFILSQD